MTPGEITRLSDTAIAAAAELTWKWMDRHKPGWAPSFENVDHDEALNTMVKGLTAFVPAYDRLDVRRILRSDIHGWFLDSSKSLYEDWRECERIKAQRWLERDMQRTLL